MRNSLIRLMVLLLVVVPFLGVWANESSAASTRVAVIKELKGTVKVKKAGGSKEFTAFAKMSLNEGDVLSVGSDGSAVLQFANGTSEDDKMTVGDNTKLSFSKLSNKKGTTTKVSMWSGSAWVDVKSIASKDDQFTLETPTAVMGVRGTHFMTTVNPVTGSTQLSVAGGIVSMTPPVPKGTAVPPPQLIYPSQSILTLPGGTGGPKIDPAPVDPSTLVDQAGPALIEAMLKASIEIQQENARLMSQYTKELGILQSDLDRVQNNINNLVSVLVNEALQSKIIQQSVIDKIQEELLKTAGEKIDLSMKELLLTIEERRKQEAQREAERIAKEAAERLKQEEEKKQEKELLEKLKKKQQEQKKAIEEEIKKKQDKAFSDYESKLSDADKKRLQDDKKNLSEAQSPSPSVIISNGGGGGSSSGSPDSSPSSSASSDPYTNPLQSLRVGYKIYSDPIVDHDVPLGSVESSYEYEVPSAVNYIMLTLVKAAAFEDYDVKISVNGKPYSYIDEDNNQYDLTLADNEIAIELKPHGQYATSANTKKFTLYVIKPSLPDGVDITTTNDGESLTWDALGNGHFRAQATAAAVSEITFNPTYNGEAVAATLNCYSYGNCEELQVDGLSVRNLVEGEVYYFSLSIDNEYLNFEFINYFEEPDWQPFFFDNVEFQEDSYAGPYVHFAELNGELYAEVSFFAKQLNMSYYGETEEGDFFPLVGLWDERNWTYVDSDSQEGCSESDDCDNLQQGDNRFTLYVEYRDGIYEHQYSLNVHQNEPFQLFQSAIGEHSGGLQDWYVGDRTWAVYAPAHETELVFSTFDELKINGSSGDGQIQLGEVVESEISVVKATYMDLPGEYVLNVNVTNMEEPDTIYAPYKLIIYNGLPIDFNDYLLTDITYDGDLYVHTLEDVTINSDSVGTGKEIVGVFDRLGNPVPQITEGAYFLDASLYGYYYVVVRDTITNYKVTTVIDLQYYY